MASVNGCIAPCASGVLCRVAFRKKTYAALETLQTDLDAWLLTTTLMGPTPASTAMAKHRCRALWKAYL